MLNEEKTLIKMSLIFSLIGLGILMLLQKSQTTEATPINTINEETLNKMVRVSGTITSARELPTIFIAKLKDNTGSIDVVAFRSDTIEIKRGNNVEVEGKVKKYKENLQVEAKRITVKS